MNIRKGVLFLLSICIVFSSVESANAKNHAPTQAEIDAARKSENAKKAIADAASKKLALAVKDLRQLSQLANVANQKYLTALAALKVANTNKIIADKAYSDAVAAVITTHNDIGRLAISAYKTGGSLSDLETLLDAKGPQDLMDRLSTLENLGAQKQYCT
jgi:hypothetical protein